MSGKHDLGIVGGGISGVASGHNCEAPNTTAATGISTITKPSNTTGEYRNGWADW